MCPSESGNVDLNYKIRAVEFWRSGSKDRKPLGSVQHQFRKVKSIQQLYRWEAALANGGTRREQLLSIVQYVLDKFQTAIDQDSLIHDIDIRRWALEGQSSYIQSRPYLDHEFQKSAQHRFEKSYKIRQPFRTARQGTFTFNIFRIRKSGKTIHCYTQSK